MIEKILFTQDSVRKYYLRKAIGSIAGTSEPGAAGFQPIFRLTRRLHITGRPPRFEPAVLMSTQSLFERFYYSRPDFLGGTREFHNECRRWAPQNAQILEIGSGPTNNTTKLLASLGNVCGIDIGKEVLENKYLDRADVFDGAKLPYPDESFDFCVSDFVLEHIEEPEQHFSEVSRVLKPGSKYCFRTMNLWHYVSLTSRLLPHSVHLQLANRLRNLPANAHEPYPTFYRANARRCLRRLAGSHGLAVETLKMVEPEPSYGRAHPLLFYPMMAYERVVNSTELFSRFRVTIIGVLEKLLRGSEHLDEAVQVMYGQGQ